MSVTLSRCNYITRPFSNFTLKYRTSNTGTSLSSGTVYFRINDGTWVPYSVQSGVGTTYVDIVTTVTVNLYDKIDYYFQTYSPATYSYSVGFNNPIYTGQVSYATVYVTATAVNILLYLNICSSLSGGNTSFCPV